MPRIFDNIEEKFLPALCDMLKIAVRSDFCVGYFRLRGWDSLAPFVERLPGGETDCCRVLVGMHRPPAVAMEEAQKAIRRDQVLDGPTVARLRREAAESFKQQIEFGIPSNQAETALRTLARQLRDKKAQVKLFLRYPLHAKLYLTYRTDPAAPLVAFLGSSNLTFSGLSHQGELNVDVVEQDAAKKLQKWFDDRWVDKFAFDISAELADLIENSWASEKLVLPYHVYLKIVYYLSEEARRGEREFKLPKVFQNVLLDFQEKAVSLAAHYLHVRGGVMLGDVVGLGKTMMASAIARIFQEDDGSNTLVICPPKLEKMWRWYMGEYGITGDVVSLGRVIQDLPNTRAYRLVIIDESHNLRNRDSKRYRFIKEYLDRDDVDARVILLSATPYNKHFTDLSNQLRLIMDEDLDLHVRPEMFFKWWGTQGKSEADFIAQYQASPRSIRAFEQSEFNADWRDLMRLFLVRRTRQYIIEKYAKYDPEKNQSYVMLKGKPFYFPKRQPKTVEFAMDKDNPDDQYARLYRDEVVDLIEHLHLPRYGLTHYVEIKRTGKATDTEKRVIENLNRAGRCLRGFCRTNLFKRLESSGYCFLLSLQRHILRNMVSIYALENGLPLPIGTQDASILDEAITDTDVDSESDEKGDSESGNGGLPALTLAAFKKRGSEIYDDYRTNQEARYSWLPASFFRKDLKENLLADCEALLHILKDSGNWIAKADAKLAMLQKLTAKTHTKEKVLVFTQFADTAEYLGRELEARGITSLQVVSGNSDDPVTVARRFSPESNGGLQAGTQELRILIATDVLAEGQNLQDAHIVVNYDLPWAIIRLVQRAGRVDRIGQKHDTIFIYSFMPAEGVNKIIHLRERLSRRLKENGEVIGTDDSFFGEEAANKLRNLYAENPSAVGDDQDEDVDIASRADQIWNSAAEKDRKIAEALPPVISATRPAPVDAEAVKHPGGVITYLRFPDSSDALVHVDARGNLVSQSICALFNATACAPDTPALPRAENHHDLVAKAVEWSTEEQNSLGGQLGSARNIRRKVYERIKNHRQVLRENPNLFSKQTLQRLDPAFNHIFRFQLKESARDSLSRQLKLGITDEALADMVIHLHDEEKLCIVTDEIKEQEPHIVCSMGFSNESLSKKDGK